MHESQKTSRIEAMANRTTLEIEQNLQSELVVLTEAQSELDQAMATIAPLQGKVADAQSKVNSLMVELQQSLGVVTRRGRGYVLSLRRALAEQQESVAEPARRGRRGRGRAKKAPVKRNFSPESRIAAARRAAEMQARRKGLSRPKVRAAGEAAAQNKRRALGL
jgi:hypothetical protein